MCASDDLTRVKQNRKVSHSHLAIRCTCCEDWGHPRAFDAVFLARDEAAPKGVEAWCRLNSVSASHMHRQGARKMSESP